VVFREEIGDAGGPFDDGDGVRVGDGFAEGFLHDAGVGEAVEVEVGEGEGAGFIGIGFGDSEGGGGDTIGDAESLCDAFC